MPRILIVVLAALPGVLLLLAANIRRNRARLTPTSTSPEVLQIVQNIAQMQET